MRGLISQSLSWSCSFLLTKPSRLVSDTWQIKIMPSLETDITYRPQGEVAIPVISFLWTFRDCSTMLSKTELKTLRQPYSVPPRMAGTFHWLVSQHIRTSLNPPTANIFCTSFSTLTSRTTDFPLQTPAESRDFAVFQYTQLVQRLLPWVHFLPAHYLLSDLGSPCFHSEMVPSMPTEQSTRSSGFHSRSVMMLEWSLILPISSRVQLLYMLMRWTLLFWVFPFWRGQAAARNCPPWLNLRQQTPLTSISLKFLSSFQRMWQSLSLSQQPTAMQQPRGCRARQLISQLVRGQIPSLLLSKILTSSHRGCLQFHSLIIFSFLERVAKMGRCRQTSKELISPWWKPSYKNSRTSPSIILFDPSTYSHSRMLVRLLTAIALLLKAKARSCSSGHIAMLTTFADFTSPMYHFLTRSPVYSSQKFYSLYSRFIQREKWPLLEPTRKPRENTQIEVREVYVSLTGDSKANTLLRCLLTSKLLPTGPIMKSSPLSVPIIILVLSNQAWAVKFLALGNFLTSSQALKEQSSTLKSLKIFLPAQLMRWDWVGQMAMESVPSTLKLLTARPLLRLMSRNMSWLSGSAVMQQAYLGWEGEKVMILKVDCLSVWGSLKCLISESLFLRPQRLRRRKFQFLIFSQTAMWFLVGEIAMHSMVYTLSESFMNSILLDSNCCLTMDFPTVYTIFILPSSSIIPISFLVSNRKFDPKAWFRSRQTFFSGFYIQIQKVLLLPQSIRLFLLFAIFHEKEPASFALLLHCQ